MGRFVKWVRPPAQFKYGLIAAQQIIFIDDTDREFLFPIL